MAEDSRKHWFTRVAAGTSRVAGKPGAFLVAAAVIIAWAVTGPLFHFSDTWQLVINTGTTVVTFLMVFLIQATQNRDSHAVQVKLDELLRVTQGAHNTLIGLEELEAGDLEKVSRKYADLARQAREARERGEPDTGVPKVS